uniref:Uncharacterized protein TCIL3000_10_8070 n=1 Tax=Trypanosoma congolense (strain IL3000) TaxID=1068625 RepID=G0UXB4_TRYCI|nr:unnamed protein product [Trypanosoma congolense IL3000]
MMQSTRASRTQERSSVKDSAGCAHDILPLYDIDSPTVPERLRDNPYVLTGYRAQYDTTMCLRSFFTLHNETLNVWTHAFGFVLFVLLSFLLFSSVVLSREYVWHSIVYGSFSFACLLCMFCSTFYHLFMCHEKESLSLFAEALDYYGISVLIVGSYIPLLYIGFACKPYYQAIYMLCIISLGVLSVVLLALDNIRESKYRCLRLVVYIALAASGVVPLLHLYALTPRNAEVMMTFKGVVLMFSLYSTGVFFYTTRIPESLFPGRFDLYLSSHQIWHVFVLSAACVHFFSCTALYQQWLVSRDIC